MSRILRYPSLQVAWPLVFAVAAAASASAQTPGAVDLDRIEVTEQRASPDYAPADTAVAGYAATPLERIPQSVQVLDRALIDDQGVLSVADLLGNVASASSALPRSVPFATGSTQIRGLPARVLRDGLRDIDFGDIDTSALVNVERVDVLKGPAGLVYGNGAPGGIVNIVSKRPLDTRLFKASATVGGRDTRIGSVDVNLPLARGLALRATGEAERSDSPVDFAEVHRNNHSVALGYDAGTAFTALARYQRLSSRDDGAMVRVGLPTVGTLVDRDRIRIDRATYLGEPNFDFQNAFGSMLYGEASYRFGPAFALTAQVRRTEVNFEQAEIRTLGAVDLETRRVARSRARQLDLEEEQDNARLFGLWSTQGAGWSNELTVGVETFDFDLLVENRLLPNAVVPSIDVLDPQYLPPGTLEPSLGPVTGFTARDRTREAFAQNVLRIGATTYTGALRRSEVEFADGTQLDDVLYQLGATHEFSPGISLFAGVSTGFEANNDITLALSGDGARFEPEFFRQTELGVKTRMAADVTGTFSLFDIRRRNIVVPDPVDADLSQQIGAERSRGFEADLVWQPVSRLQLRGGYAYLDTEITDDSDPARVGNRRAGVPRHLANAYANYRFDNGPLAGLRLGAGFTYSGRAFASVSNTIERPAYMVANLSASYVADRYRVDAFLSNAFDEEYFIPRNDSTVNAGDPRLLTLRFSTWF